MSVGYIDQHGEYIVRPRRMGYSRTTDLTESSQYRAGERDLQRFDHAFELIQPYKGGAPNDEFTEMYPDEAKLYGFTPGSEDD